MSPCLVPAAVPHPSGMRWNSSLWGPTGCRMNGLSFPCPAVLPSSRPCSPRAALGPAWPVPLSPFLVALGALPSWALGSGFGRAQGASLSSLALLQPLSRGETGAGCIRCFHGRSTVFWRKRTSSSARLIYILVQATAAACREQMKEKSQLTLVANSVCISPYQYPRGV